MLSMANKQHMRTCSRCHGTGLEIDPVAVGAAMRAKRIAAKHSLRSVAGFMGFSAAYISDLERGNRAFSEELITVYEKAIRTK